MLLLKNSFPPVIYNNILCNNYNIERIKDNKLLYPAVYNMLVFEKIGIYCDKIRKPFICCIADVTSCVGCNRAWKHFKKIRMRKSFHVVQFGKT